MNCKYCRANCTGAKHDREIALCLGYDPPKTNGERIRAMTDEELATVFTDDLCELLCNSPHTCDSECELHMLTWLKQECEE